MSDVNNEPLRIDDDYYIKLRAGVDATPTLGARNLTDEDIVPTVAGAVAQEGKLIGHYGALRIWGTTLRKNW